MLRSEIEKNSGLTRKAIEYYEEKGLIQPSKNESGYREYSEEDLAILRKIFVFRRLGFGVAEISGLLHYGDSILTSILRKNKEKVKSKRKKWNCLRN